MKTQKFNPKDWVRKYPKLARVCLAFLAFVVFPIIALPMCLFETHKRTYKASQVWRQFKHKLRTAWDLYKEMLAYVFLPWEFPSA